MPSLEPLRVLVTGAAGQISYSLLQFIARGDVFGLNQPIILHMLDIEPMMSVVQGVVMELQDCAFPTLHGTVVTFKLEEAFKDVDIVFMVGAMPRREGMERKDLLHANVKIFREQGRALDQYAKKTALILVVGNPANTNALIVSHYAPSIPKENFSALTRLDHNRAQAQIASRLGVPCDNVSDVIIWGNHSNTQFADAFHAKVTMKDGSKKSVREAVANDAWLQGEFLKTVQVRGAEVIKARKLSSAMSAAKAIMDHMHDWWFGTSGSGHISMAVFSDGSYGQPAGIMYSFPITIDKQRKWKIVQGYEIDNWSKEKMKITADELVAEREEALQVCQD